MGTSTTRAPMMNPRRSFAVPPSLRSGLSRGSTSAGSLIRCPLCPMRDRAVCVAVRYPFCCRFSPAFAPPTLRSPLIFMDLDDKPSRLAPQAEPCVSPPRDTQTAAHPQPHRFSRCCRRLRREHRFARCADALHVDRRGLIESTSCTTLIQTSSYNGMTLAVRRRTRLRSNGELATAGGHIEQAVA